MSIRTARPRRAPLLSEKQGMLPVDARLKEHRGQEHPVCHVDCPRQTTVCATG